MVVALTLASASTAAPDPLRGEWDTGRLSLAVARDAALRAGYTEAEFRRFIRLVCQTDPKAWEMSLRFYRRNRPSVEVTLWDPTQRKTTSASDHGPYAFLPNNRVVFSSSDPQRSPWREYFTWRVSGSRLTLKAVAETDPTLTKERLRLDELVIYVIAAAPYVRKR